MANNYRQFSFLLDLGSPSLNEEFFALFKGLSSIEAFGSFDGIMPNSLRAGHECFRDFPKDMLDEDYISGYNSFCCEKDDEKNWDRLWIHADESGDAYIAALLIHYFLKRHKLDISVSFCFSDTCSSMRVDEFGGGAFFITTRCVQSLYASDWIDDKEKNFRMQKHNRLTKGKRSARISRP